MGKKKHTYFVHINILSYLYITLQYSQTGSGKTFSMGTSLDNSVSAENEG